MNANASIQAKPQPKRRDRHRMNKKASRNVSQRL
jgi:hypothetical protein